MSTPKTRNSTPDSHRMYLRGTALEMPLPARAPMSEVAHIARVPPMNMMNGYPSFEVRAMRESWVLSPSSSRAMRPMVATKGLLDFFFSMISRSSSSSLTGRNEMTPAMIKIAAATYLMTSFGTYLANNTPTVTARPFTTTKATAAPRNTERKPYLAASVRMAICVLSPKSATNVSPNAAPSAFHMMHLICPISSRRRYHHNP